MNFLILQEKRPWKSKFVQNFKGLLVLTGRSHGYLTPVFRHLSVLSQNCSFATLVTVRESYDNLNIDCSLRFNENCTGHLKVAAFHKPYSSSYGLSKMVLL